MHLTGTKSSPKILLLFSWRLSDLVIFIRFLQDFIYGLLLSNSGSSLNMGFVERTITKMADKMAAAFHFALDETLP